MLCAKCGTPAEPGDKFCYVCGNPVNTGNKDIPVPKLAKEAPDIDITPPKAPETGGKGKLIVGLLGLAVICFALAVSKFGTGVMFPQTAHTRQQYNNAVQRKPSKESDLNIPMSTNQLKAFRESQANSSEMNQAQKEIAKAVVNAHLIANDNPTKKQLLDEIKNEVGKFDGMLREAERISEALKEQPHTNAPTPQTPQSTKTSISQDELDYHWFKDSRTGVLIWNPTPNDGETVTWNGESVQDGKYRYANGKGVSTWYLNGAFEQKDEGTYVHGYREGRFKHTMADGRVKYTKWHQGTKVN